MTGERFIATMLAMTSEADPLRHRSVVETTHYKLITVLVRDQEQAVKVCKDLVNEEGVESFLLCPGFTSKGVGKIAEAVGDNISVNVARGSGPSNAIARKANKRMGLV